MQKLRKVGGVVMAVCLFLVLSATAALAQATDPDTPAEVRDGVIATATPYVATIAGIVLALFGLVLLATLARKAAGMAKGAIRKG